MKIPSQACEMQLCLHNRKSQLLKNNVWYHCVEQRLIYQIHAYGSISERPVPCANHSTAQLIENWNNSQVNYCIQVSNLQTQHILTSQSYLRVAKRNSTVTVIIILKTF